MLEINVEKKDNIVIIHIIGSFSISEIDNFEEIWKKEILNKPDIIAVNFQYMEYIDSMGISNFIKLDKNLKDAGIELFLYDLNDPIDNLFKMAKVDKFINIISKEKFHKEYFK
jgi:anti-anti-sigma factor